MPKIEVDVRLRPIRFGFLVRPNDRKSLLKIFRTNTCLWGGMYNPIIPVVSRVPSWWNRHPYQVDSASSIVNGYIDFFEPDFIVESTKGLSRKLGFAEDRIIQLDELLTSTSDRDHSGVGLSVNSLYGDLYKKTFQFSRRFEHDIIEVNPGRVSYELFAASVFGGFPESEETQFFQDDFQTVFSPKEMTLSAAAFSEVLQNGYHSALDIGSTQLDVRKHSHHNPSLFVFDPHAPQDLIDFWNLRTLRRKLVPIPIQWVDELDNFINEFAKTHHRPLPGNPNGVMIRPTLMFARSIDDESLAKVCEKFVEIHLVRQDFYPSFWRSLPEYIAGDIRAETFAKTKRSDVNYDAQDPYAIFDSLTPDFAPKYGNHNRWANVIRMSRRFDTGDIATSFPADYRDPKLRLGHFGRETISTREGLIRFGTAEGLQHYVKLTDGNTAIQQWLKAEKIPTETSDAGRATKEVVSTLGGPRNVQAIAHPDIVRLLAKVARKPKKALRLKEFRGRIVEATKNNFHLDRNFQRIVDSGAVSLGLEVRCTHCTTWTWHSLTELNYELTCGLCLKAFSFPVQAPDHDHGGKWSYRLIGPFALDNYANGAYASALSIRFFSEALGAFDGIDVTWASGQILSLDENQVEVDFLLWFQRKEMFDRDHATNFVFGESKSFGADAFKQDDVDRLQAVAKRFPGSVLVFSTMKEPKMLSAGEVSRLRKLALWGRKRIGKHESKRRASVIVLTGNELFCPDDIERTWIDLGGSHAEFANRGMLRLDNLHVLAEVTQQLYLNLPPIHE